VSGARVIPLPGAAATRVENPKRRGGTPPSNVTRRAVLEGRRHRRAMLSKRPGPNQQVISMLGRLQELAEAGELQGLALVYNYAGRFDELETIVAAKVDWAIVGDLGRDTSQLSRVVMRMLYEMMTGREGQEGA
jgi:hypothetical protein